MIQRGAALTAAFTAAPIVIDSLTLPAAAATGDFPWSTSTPNTYTMYPPCSSKRELSFELRGAGGAGGSANVAEKSRGGTVAPARRSPARSTPHRAAAPATTP